MLMRLQAFSCVFIQQSLWHAHFTKRHHYLSLAYMTRSVTWNLDIAGADLGGGGSLGSDEPPLKGTKNFYVHIVSPFVNVK